MYRIMCFNVLSHNRDDHAKNLSCIYTEEKGWRLAPAYDLTYSDTYFGEHKESGEELFYFCKEKMPYLCGLWCFANA